MGLGFGGRERNLARGDQGLVGLAQLGHVAHGADHAFLAVDRRAHRRDQRRDRLAVAHPEVALDVAGKARRLDLVGQQLGLRAVIPEIKLRRYAADHFIMAVTGALQEFAVDVDDVAVDGAGDDDRVRAGLEHAAEFFFAFTELQFAFAQRLVLLCAFAIAHSESCRALGEAGRGDYAQPVIEDVKVRLAGQHGVDQQRRYAEHPEPQLPGRFPRHQHRRAQHNQQQGDE